MRTTGIITQVTTLGRGYPLQPAANVGQTARQYAAGLLTVGEQRLTQRSRQGVHYLNRVFYKELKEGACKIVDVNVILLA